MFTRTYTSRFFGSIFRTILLAGLAGWFLLNPVLLGARGPAFAAGEMIRPKLIAKSGPAERSVIPTAGARAYKGYTLFLMNCAHCHGNDARGDEGPDLHGVTKSDARITSIIKNGIKGEMPKFGSKLTDADVQALIAFVRSLKE